MLLMTVPTLSGACVKPYVVTNAIKNAVVRAPAKLPTKTRPQFLSMPAIVTPGRLSSQARGQRTNTPVSRSKPNKISIENPTGNRSAPTSGWPVFTANALAPVDPKRTKFISFDTNPPAPDLLKAGKVQVLLGQKYFGWGSESVRLLHDIVNGKRPANPIIDSGVDVVTADNVDAYVKLWKTMESGGS